jgi:DNA-binding NtrC family response regulator
LDALVAHDWPGNVRELANMIERAVVLCGGTEIGTEDLALSAKTVSGAVAAASPVVDVGDFHDGVKAYKQALIRAALQEADGNQTRAAGLLGLQRTYLVKLLRSLSIRDDA